MDELVRWLGEQLDEDERIARATHSVFLAWDYDDCVMQIRDLGNGNEIAHVLPRHAYGEHIAEHDPARVLREIDAKRQILALHRPVQRRSTGSSGGTIADCQVCGHFPAQFPCATLRLLAAPYADRPGYRDKWRP